MRGTGLPTRLLRGTMVLRLLFVDLTFREFHEHGIKESLTLE
jgi:hypothetical protein